MSIDVGTGDGRAVLAAATREPETLAIGIDANAASMAELSSRAARPARKGGLANTLFVVAAAETLPIELAGLADHVTVQFPWGSLLRGCLGGDPRVAAGLVSLLRPDARLELLLAPSEADRLGGLPTDPGAIVRHAGVAFAPSGLSVVEGRLATGAELRSSRSTWARRLDPARSGRPVVLVRLRMA